MSQCQDVQCQPAKHLRPLCLRDTGVLGTIWAGDAPERYCDEQADETGRQQPDRLVEESITDFLPDNARPKMVLYDEREPSHGYANTSENDACTKSANSIMHCPSVPSPAQDQMHGKTNHEHDDVRHRHCDRQGGCDDLCRRHSRQNWVCRCPDE
ncbi:hypothetical protein Avi_2763 [Allorhizobium ampelinum S4]|uniref:Uncharacterized protein n=1 Tax=Allorhizobium ampelinum (strain ATCC BAA-846 / DSM 112012 / S4) TaxID=311402 RepID=B9JXL6_ALLAM|nr:hypothetical protein Avi_2763 [Allorhizobium ampelinum S4]